MINTLHNEEDDEVTLNMIMAEIEAAGTPREESEEPSTAIVKKTSDDLDDRRAKAWDLRMRGKTYREIGTELDVSIGTVKRDLDTVKRNNREKVEFYDREDHIASNLSMFDDIVKEAWNVHTGADKETKLKALNLIRQTIQAKEKSLQANGVVRKETQVQEIVQISLVSNFDEKGIGVAAAALLSSQMQGTLSAPTPDIDDAEFEEIEEDDIE